MTQTGTRALQKGTSEFQGAWSGSRDVVVAVIDTEFDLDHPDVARNVWINQNEIPTSITWDDYDDDGLLTFYDLNPPNERNSGIVADSNLDGVITASDIAADTTWQAAQTGNEKDIVGWDATDSNSWSPDNSNSGTAHGTQVMSVLAAVAGDELTSNDGNPNMIGVAPRVRVLPIQVDGEYGQWKDAVEYVRDLKEFHDVNVVAINVSLEISTNVGTGPGTVAEANEVVRSLLQHDIAYVDAAGNDKINLAFAGPTGDGTIEFLRPTHDDIIHWLDSPGAVLVGGTSRPPNADGSLAPTALWESPMKGSNYGKSKEVELQPINGGPKELQWAHSVDVLAPGEGIIMSSDRDITDIPSGTSGTSFAAPQVAGAIALLKSRFPTLKVTNYNGNESTIDTHRGRQELGDVCILPDGKGIIEYLLCASHTYTESASSTQTQNLLNVSDHGFLRVDLAYQDILEDLQGTAGARDLNLDGSWNGDDIDYLYAAHGTLQGYYGTSSLLNVPWFDIDRDGVFRHQETTDPQGSVTVTGDVGYYIVIVLEIHFGDVNFDEEFTSTDMVLAFNAGEFEDNFDADGNIIPENVGNSGWIDGDWNGDGEFDQEDINFVGGLGGYTA